jgi:hypothetical protein
LLSALPAVVRAGPPPQRGDSERAAALSVVIHACNEEACLPRALTAAAAAASRIARALIR